MCIFSDAPRNSLYCTLSKPTKSLFSTVNSAKKRLIVTSQAQILLPYRSRDSICARCLGEGDRDLTRESSSLRSVINDNKQMDLQEAHAHLLTFLNRFSEEFQKLPGSAILLRYIKSSYQNDPIRSAVELFLVLFAVRYLLAPKYSTKPNYVTLSEEVRWLWASSGALADTS